MRTTTQRKDAQMQQLSLSERQKILQVIMEQPEYGAKRISEILAASAGGEMKIPPKLVYQELKRLRLSTKEERYEYVAKKKVD